VIALREGAEALSSTAVGRIGRPNRRPAYRAIRGRREYIVAAPPSTIRNTGYRHNYQRRRLLRRTRNHSSWISFDRSVKSFECQVLDISADGAKLVADIAGPIGSKFRLLWPARDRRSR
jgi:hypothetical protein